MDNQEKENVKSSWYNTDILESLDQIVATKGNNVKQQNS